LINEDKRLKTKGKRKENVVMQLTKAEEQVMQILWDMKDGLVKDIRDSFSDPKPARNTVSTVLRILEKKGYVGHKAYGNVHLYHPLVSRSEYSKSQLFGLMESYFNNSFPAMASFFAREKDLTMKELEELRIQEKNCRKIKNSGNGSIWIVSAKIGCLAFRICPDILFVS
jgi:BlaI family penicillinase repressor